MIFPDGSPDDLLNHHLKVEATRAQERGDAFSVWHGRDVFSTKDAELYINLEDRTGALALGASVFPGRFLEDGPSVLMTFSNPHYGQVALDLDSEELDLNPGRLGVEYAGGEDAQLRLFDRLTGETVIEVGGDQLHSLVDEKVLDPKNYTETGLAYARTVGVI